MSPTSRVRALHVAAGKVYGGIEAMLVTMARYAGEHPALQSEYAVCFEGRLSRELRELNAAVHVIGEVRMRRPWQWAGAALRLRGVLRAGSFDAAVIHGTWPYALFAPAIRQRSQPVALWCHGVLSSPQIVDRAAGLMRPDLLIANSECTLSSAQPMFRAARTSVVHCPVAPPAENLDRQQCRAALGLAQSQLAIVTVGRMEAGKGHLLFVDALHQLADVPDWVALIVGGGQTPDELRYFQLVQQRVRELQLEHRVRFLGQRSDVYSVLVAADVYCQPTIRPESFGISIVEALYCGLPVVTTRMGGPIEILGQGRYGELVEPHPADVAAALRSLVVDARQRDQLRSTARARASELCAPAARLAQVRQILAAARRGGA
jgi:glycosyltransferase involved in cell wall biosynthesis